MCCVLEYVLGGAQKLDWIWSWATSSSLPYFEQWLLEETISELATSAITCFCEMIKQEGISFSFAFPTVDFSLLQMAQLLGVSD